MFSELAKNIHAKCLYYYICVCHFIWLHSLSFGMCVYVCVCVWQSDFVLSFLRIKPVAHFTMILVWIIAINQNVNIWKFQYDEHHFWVSPKIRIAFDLITQFLCPNNHWFKLIIVQKVNENCNYETHFCPSDGLHGSNACPKEKKTFKKVKKVSTKNCARFLRCQFQIWTGSLNHNILIEGANQTSTNWNSWTV